MSSHHEHICFVVVALGGGNTPGEQATDEDLEALAREITDKTGLVAHPVTDKGVCGRLQLHFISEVLADAGVEFFTRQPIPPRLAHDIDVSWQPDQGGAA